MQGRLLARLFSKNWLSQLVGLSGSKEMTLYLMVPPCLSLLGKLSWSPLGLSNCEGSFNPFSEQSPLVVSSLLFGAWSLVTSCLYIHFFLSFYILSVFYQQPTEGYPEVVDLQARCRQDQELSGAHNTWFRQIQAAKYRKILRLVWWFVLRV